MESLMIVICVLVKERQPLTKYNQQMFNDIITFQSVNGYNKEETKRELKQSGLQLHSLNHDGQNFGTIANWLTKYQLIKYQVDMQIPYMCMLEDDVQLKPGFKSWIFDNKAIIDENNITRLLIWGEGYILSLAGAQNVLECLHRDGICLNVDNQLRTMCGKEQSFFNLVPLEELPYFLNAEYASASSINKTEAIDTDFLFSE